MALGFSFPTLVTLQSSRAPIFEQRELRSSSCLSSRKRTYESPRHFYCSTSPSFEAVDTSLPSNTIFRRIPIHNPSSIKPASICSETAEVSSCHQSATRVEVSEEEKLESFLKWLNENGASTEGLQIETHSDVRCRSLTVTSNVEAGERIVSVPDRLFLCSENLETSPLAVLFDEFEERISLALLLLYELSRKEDSFFQPYIAILPEKTGCCLEWSEELLQSLTGSSILADAQAIRESVDCVYEDVLEQLKRVLPDLVEEQVITQDKFRWAMGIVYTRAIAFAGFGEGFGEGYGVTAEGLTLEGMPVEGLRRPQALTLVPLADMCNHGPSTGPVQSWVLDRRKFCITAQSSLKAGDQVLFSYGPAPNFRLMTHYGFATENNEHDAIDIPMELNDEDPLWDGKVRRLRTFDLGVRERFWIRRKDLPSLPEPLLKMLAVIKAESIQEMSDQILEDAVWDSGVEGELISCLQERLRALEETPIAKLSAEEMYPLKPEHVAMSLEGERVILEEVFRCLQ